MIDILIFVAFFVLNIVVGFRYRGKNQSFQEYAIGDKKFSTAVLTATIVATWMSGSALFINLENTYKQGLYYVIPDIIGTPMCLLITGYIVGPRMGKFLNNLSVPESLGKLYGKPVQAIAGISIVLRSTGYVAMQLQVIAKTLTILFNYEGPAVVTIAAIIITLYTLSGGVKAVTFTDVLQFFTFGTLLPILALTIWNNLQNSTQVTHMFQNNPLMSFKEVVRWSPEFMNSLVFMAYLMTPALQPQLFQRIVMARDTAQIKHSFGYATIICLGIELCMIWIAIMMLVDQPSLETDKIMQHIVNTHTYPGFKGLLGIGIIAMSMSTADSVLNSCAVIIANDILPPLGLHKQRSLNTARWATLVLGTLGLVMALSTQNLLQVLLGAAHFYIPSVAPAPMLLAIFGFKTSRRVVLLAMGAGATATAACLFYFKSVHSFLPGMLANLITMLGLHYLLGEEGGWQRLAPNDPLALEGAARKQRWQWRLNKISNFKLYPYLQQNLPAQEGLYFFFGLYTMVATYAAFYTIGNTDHQACQAIYTCIYHTVLPMATAFLTFPVWPTPLKNTRFMAFFWPLSIAFILFFAGTLLAIMSHFHHMQVMVMMINLLIAVLLLRWPLALFLAFTGTYAAVFFFAHYTGSALPLSTFGSLQMIYLILLFASLLIALKGQQVYRGLVISYAQLKEDNRFTSQVFLATLRHQARLQQEASIYPVEALEPTESLQEFHQAPTKSQVMASNAALHQHVYTLDTLNKYLQQVLHLAQEPIHLVVENVALTALWQEVLKTLYQHPQAVKVLIQHNTTTQSLRGDGEKIRKLLLDAVFYAASQQKADRPVLVGIEDTQLAYPILSIPGYIKQVKSVCIAITTEVALPSLKKWYVGSVEHQALRWPRDMEELAITYNQQIVAAHYGASEIISTATGVTQVYVLPSDVREVRPPTMDQWQGVPTVDIDATTVHPSEAAFVKNVLAKTRMKRRLLQEALQLIKQCHAGAKHGIGEPAYLHPIAVANILLQHTQDPDTLLAALLHDAIDTTCLSWHHIALRFNPVVKRIVDGVAAVDSRLSSFKKIQLSAHETILKLLEAKDERVLYVKIADRLHHMRTIEGHPSLAKQKEIAEEALQFFVPMARSLGLKSIAEELKERCFAVLTSTQ